MQVRLQHDAGVPIALLPHRLEDVERDRGERRVLHVDPDEELVRVAASRIRRRLSTQVARSTVRPSCVSFSERLRSTPARGDLLDERDVGARRGVGLGDRRRRSRRGSPA